MTASYHWPSSLHRALTCSPFEKLADAVDGGGFERIGAGAVRGGGGTPVEGIAAGRWGVVCCCVCVGGARIVPLGRGGTGIAPCGKGPGVAPRRVPGLGGTGCGVGAGRCVRGNRLRGACPGKGVPGRGGCACMGY
jgi:hypothetical protein